MAASRITNTDCDAMITALALQMDQIITVVNSVSREVCRLGRAVDALALQAAVEQAETATPDQTLEAAHAGS